MPDASVAAALFGVHASDLDAVCKRAFVFRGYRSWYFEDGSHIDQGLDGERIAWDADGSRVASATPES